jgi:hypothetical protein
MTDTFAVYPAARYNSRKEGEMISITCDKCRRRFTPTVEELQTYLAASEGKRHAQVLCPHCGKANKVSPLRLRHAISPAVAPAPAPQPSPVAAAATPPPADETADAAAGDETA